MSDFTYGFITGIVVFTALAFAGGYILYLQDRRYNKPGFRKEKK